MNRLVSFIFGYWSNAPSISAQFCSLTLLLSFLSHWRFLKHIFFSLRLSVLRFVLSIRKTFSFFYFFSFLWQLSLTNFPFSNVHFRNTFFLLSVSRDFSCWVDICASLFIISFSLSRFLSFFLPLSLSLSLSLSVKFFFFHSAICLSSFFFHFPFFSFSSILETLHKFSWPQFNAHLTSLYFLACYY